MSVSIYNRQTVGGRRQYFLANKTSTGPFYLRYEKDGKRTWHPAHTSNYTFALAAAKRMEASLLTQEVTPPKPSPKAERTLEEQRTAFLHDKETTFKNDGSKLDGDTIDSYYKVTAEFLALVRRTYAKEVTKQDLKDWLVAQRQRVSHRTVCNLYVSIACFLKFCGIDHKTLLPRSERPVPVEETPEAYTQDEMTKFFFNVIGERDALAFEFLLKTGAREQEMCHLDWTDLNLGTSPTVKIQTKEGFRTKTGKSRVIPLEGTLATKLTAWRVKNPASHLVFGTVNDQPFTHFLEVCKKTAVRAGFDRKNFWLHKFRDTFATWSLRRGVDIRTVQHWLGHASIEMTQRYLAPEQGEYAQRQINQAFSGGLFDSATA
jgi:integrase/recombinase XerD